MTQEKSEFENLKIYYYQNLNNNKSNDDVIMNMRKNLIGRNDNKIEITIEDIDDNNNLIDKVINISNSDFQYLLKIDGELFKKECSRNFKQINNAARGNQTAKNNYSKDNPYSHNNK